MPTTSVQPAQLRRLALLELVRRIAQHSDREALAELHDRRPVFTADGNPLRLAEFIHWLGDSDLARRRKADALKHPGVNEAIDVLGGEILDIRPLSGPSGPGEGA